MGRKTQRLLRFAPGTYYSKKGNYAATVGNDRVALCDGNISTWDLLSILLDGTLSFSAGDVITWKLVLVSGSSFSFFGNMYLGSKNVADNVVVRQGDTYSYTATVDGEDDSFGVVSRAAGLDWSNNPRGILVEMYLNGKQVA